MKHKQIILTAVLVAMVPAAARAGGGHAPDPDTLFGGYVPPTTQVGYVPPTTTQTPVCVPNTTQTGSYPTDPNSLFDGLEAAQPQPMTNPFTNQRFSWGRSWHRRHRPHQETLLSRELAMRWYRSDANGRAYLVSYLQQWMYALDAQTQQTMYQWVVYEWNRMPAFQQQFLSAVYTPAVAAAPVPATTSLPSSPVTTLSTPTTVVSTGSTAITTPTTY